MGWYGEGSGLVACEGGRDERREKARKVMIRLKAKFQSRLSWLSLSQNLH
jgi:hypothetical protein